MEWTTKLPSGAMYSGSIEPTYKDDDVAFVVDFTRLAMKARLMFFESSMPEYSMTYVRKMAAPSKKSHAEFVALEELAVAAIFWKNSEGDAGFDTLYRAVEEFEYRERGRLTTATRKSRKHI